MRRESVIVFGLKEKVIKSKFERENDELKRAKELIGKVDDDNTELQEEIEEVYRLGKYEEGRDRPLKIRLKTQIAAGKVLSRTWKLTQTDLYKDVWIREDLNEEERTRRNELSKEAKEKNQQRSETEKNEFFWRILDGKIKKWYLRGK